MDETTKAYIAGLLDGEGCYRIDRFKTAKSPIGFQYRTTIELGMCDEGPIKFIAKATKRNYQSKPIKSGRTVYLLVWRNSIAAELIRQLLPYIIGKREQAELCLYFEEHITPGRGRTYQQSDKLLCEDIRGRVSNLKKPPALRC